ncbi:MAG: DUF4139 domain-containing protein [Bacteroidia bacterium]
MLILFWVLSFGIAHAQIKTEAKVQAVSLNPSWAFLSCTTPTFIIKPGQNQIDIGNIAKDVKVSSLSFSKIENGNITSIKVLEKRTISDDSKIRTIDSLTNLALDSLDWVEFSLLKNEQLRRLLIKNGDIEVSDKSIYVDDLDELLTYFNQKLRKLEAEKRKLDYHRNSLIYQIDSLKTAKEKRIATLEVRSKYVRVNISSTMESSTSLNFHYVTNLAGWYPCYSTTVGDKVSKMSIDAFCHQNTGVYWKSVMLNLSYGQSKKNMSSSLVQFSSNALVDLNSSDTVKINSILEQNIETTEIFYCKPSSYPLLSKQMTIAGLDGLYLPKGLLTLESNTGYLYFDSLQSTLFSDSVIYNLGYSNEVVFKRDLSKEKLRKSMLGNKQTAEIEWVVNFENKSNKSQTILIEDFLPSVIKNEIEIDLNLPRGTKINDDTFTYFFEIEPQERKEIKYGFIISAPKTIELNDYYKN